MRNKMQEMLQWVLSHPLVNSLNAAWQDDSAQDIAEYSVMLAVILVVVVGTIRLIGSSANNVFSETVSALGG